MYLDYKLTTNEMKTSKVTYRTPDLKEFNTIVPFSGEAQVMDIINYMATMYDNVTIISIRPTVKQKYAHVCNYRKL